MKKSTKAILLSALVFPGAGHLYLKAYWVGFTLISVTSVIVIYIVNNLWGQTRLKRQKYDGSNESDPIDLLLIYVRVCVPSAASTSTSSAAVMPWVWHDLPGAVTSVLRLGIPPTEIFTGYLVVMFNLVIIHILLVENYLGVRIY